MIQFNHFNFNVLNLEKSLKFYKDTLNLEPVREKRLLMAPSSWSILVTAPVTFLWSSPGFAIVQNRTISANVNFILPLLPMSMKSFMSSINSRV